MSKDDWNQIINVDIDSKQVINRIDDELLKQFRIHNYNLNSSIFSVDTKDNYLIDMLDNIDTASICSLDSNNTITQFIQDFNSLEKEIYDIIGEFSFLIYP